MSEILLCCDLDRTVLPNGLQPESPHVREIFRQVIDRCDITLAYVSGRDKALLQAAIEEYDIPVPHYAIGDVGTSLYHIQDGEWHHVQDWTQHLAQEWNEALRNRILDSVSSQPELRLQEPHKQGPFKISFYCDPQILTTTFIQQIEKRLADANTNASLIHSVDETTQTGLLDILPSRASKRHAIEFLLDYLHRSLTDTVFAGDSGNDLPVITSPIPSVLVKNALDSIKQQATQHAGELGLADACYIAQGDWLGLNGFYCAGVLEGLVHYHPTLQDVIMDVINSING